jgi:hypothetical protein
MYGGVEEGLKIRIRQTSQARDLTSGMDGFNGFLSISRSFT